MAPRAETAKSLQDEIDIINFVLSKYPKNYDGYLKINELIYRLDYVLSKSNGRYSIPRLFAEVKMRSYPFGHFPSGYMISATKRMAARALTDMSSLRCCMIVGFSDGVIASCDFSEPCSFRIGGRQDRPDFMHDIEPVAIYPWADFKILRAATS
jgi:hypothetical protein